jgi:hypothetical protein
MKPAVWCPILMAATVWLQPVMQCPVACAEGDWEITAQSEEALAHGLQWLARNQGAQGNWESNDLGLVGMGALAFMAAGHLPGRGHYGDTVQRALDYVIRNQQPSGLLNIAGSQRDMYNHGLSTFVLGQAYGMTGDARVGGVLDRALKRIAETQCDDGGRNYEATRGPNGHDLSLAVMQAKALRSAVDSGLDVSPRVIQLAISGVRLYYSPIGCPRNASEETQKQYPGQFNYNRGGNDHHLAMAAAGVVCLQEFAQYDDWRIEKNMEVICEAIRGHDHPQKARSRSRPKSRALFDPYTLYYIGQALYQVGGARWKECYPLLRDGLIASQAHGGTSPGGGNSRDDGVWHSGGHVGGRPGELYMTAVACFILAMPNRYLPILQEGHIDSLREQFQQKK